MALFAVLTSVANYAIADCPGGDWWSVEHEYRQAQFVFVGVPVSDWPDPGIDGWIAGDFYRLKVQRVFGGAPLDYVNLFSENSSGRFPMNVGTPYLVFASFCGDRLYAYSRGNSGTLREKQRLVAEIVQLTARER
jgi:hypothetical protein